jgi:DNA-binding NarL/FixJ family response regulator
MRILIADDHDVVREGLRDLLGSQPGWEVCAEGRNGIEAVELAQRLEPDVAVLDVSMPLLDGLEATRRICHSKPATEVLLFTVHASEELAAQALDAGARGYLLKSRSATELIAAIDAAARHANPPGQGAPVAGQRGRSAGHHTQGLTGREREIIQLISEGKSNKEMAAMLGISVKTVETHRSHLTQKLGSASVAYLVRYAVRNGMIDP